MLPLMLDVSRLPIALIGQGEAYNKRITLLTEAGAGKLDLYPEGPLPSVGEGWVGGACRETTADCSDAAYIPPTPALPHKGRGSTPLLTALSTGTYRLVYVAGLTEEASRPYYEAAKLGGAFVNVEDVKPLCDFHVPSIMRRGPMMITVSSDGQAAGLSKQITKHLATSVFPSVWEEHFENLVALRATMKAEGASFTEVAKALRDGFEKYLRACSQSQKSPLPHVGEG